MNRRQKGFSSQARDQEEHGSNTSSQNRPNDSLDVPTHAQAANPYSMQRLALQSALLLSGLCAAYALQPQLDRRVLLALGAALQALLIVRVLVSFSIA